MTISTELLDELLKGMEHPEDLLSEAEMTAHLGCEEGKDTPADENNRSNGTSAKVLKGHDGEMSIAVPRDRDGRVIHPFEGDLGIEFTRPSSVCGRDTSRHGHVEAFVVIGPQPLRGNLLDLLIAFETV
jgi:hypothetical protein